MGIRSIVAKILRDELVSIGIRSLTVQDSERIAAQIFKQIIDLELQLAARDLLPQAAIATRICALPCGAAATTAVQILRASSHLDHHLQMAERGRVGPKPRRCRGWAPVAPTISTSGQPPLSASISGRRLRTGQAKLWAGAQVNARFDPARGIGRPQKAVAISVNSRWPASRRVFL